MKLNIEHRTCYSFNKPVGYTIQQLRLTPPNGFGQWVHHWQIKVSGYTSMSMDTYGNTTHTLIMDLPHQEVVIKAYGEVETGIDTPPTLNDLALPVYLRHTGLTKANDEILAFVSELISGNQLVDKSIIMALMGKINRRVEWNSGSDPQKQSAIDSLSAEKALSQGLAHLFISGCRALRVPSRFVSGYHFNSKTNQLEKHCWADAWLADFGWKSFDVAYNTELNGVHIRIATGLDYRDATPIGHVIKFQQQDNLSIDFKVRQISQIQQ